MEPVPLGEAVGLGALSSDCASRLVESSEPGPELLEPEPLEDAVLVRFADEPEEDPDDAERAFLRTCLRTT